MESGLPGREVVRAVLTLPPFFISYAHAGSDSNNAAERFYYELRGDLQTLVRRPVGSSMGFFDSQGLRAAVRWREELADALGKCQVLVALLSVPYLDSEWCGKEWHAFTLRERELLPGATGFQNQGPIIPVRWAPIPFDLPPVVKDEAQFFKPQSTGDQRSAADQSDLAERYEEEGIFGLLRKGQVDDFHGIVWDLAKCIQQICYNQVLRPRVFDPSELRNVFEGGEQ
jgi:TIR domain